MDDLTGLDLCGHCPLINVPEDLVCVVSILCLCKMSLLMY